MEQTVSLKNILNILVSEGEREILSDVCPPDWEKLAEEAKDEEAPGLPFAVRMEVDLEGLKKEMSQFVKEMGIDTGLVTLNHLLYDLKEKFQASDEEMARVLGIPLNVFKALANPKGDCTNQTAAYNRSLFRKYKEHLHTIAEALDSPHEEFKWPLISSTTFSGYMIFTYVDMDNDDSYDCGISEDFVMELGFE